MSNSWTSIITRISRHEADQIDALLGRYDPRKVTPGSDLFPGAVPRSRSGIAFRKPGLACIGVRVVEPRADVHKVAMHLATLALEKNAEIIILSYPDYSGLERFGFRTERISGATPEERAACEEQILRFWGIEIVI